MSVRYAPKSKKIPGADTGAAVTGATDPTTILNGFDPTAGAADANAVKLAQVLATLNRAGPQSSHTNQSETSTAPAPVMDMLKEQGTRAQAMANSYDPSAKYLNGMEPGGLADVISQFIGKVGGAGAPALSEGNRMVNRVPLDSLGSGLQDAIDLASKVPTTSTHNTSSDTQTNEQPGKYDSQIQDLLGPLIEKFTNQQKNGDNSNLLGTDLLKKFAPSLVGDNGTGPNAYQKQEVAQSSAQEKYNEGKHQADMALGGGGVPGLGIVGDLFDKAQSAGSPLASMLSGLMNKGLQPGGGSSGTPHVSGNVGGNGTDLPAPDLSGVGTSLSDFLGSIMPSSPTSVGNGGGPGRAPGTQTQANEGQHQADLTLGGSGSRSSGEPPSHPGSPDLPSVLSDLVSRSGVSNLTDLLKPNAQGHSNNLPSIADILTFLTQHSDKYNNQKITNAGPGSVRKQADGGEVHEGPTMLHVGERSPKDKNFETSEVVLAAPGTVVAPIPKGMKATPENAHALILAQLLKTRMGGGAAKAGPGVRASAMGSVTRDEDPSGYLNSLVGFANVGSNNEVGMGRLGVDERANNQSYDLGGRKLQSDQLISSQKNATDLALGNAQNQNTAMGNSMNYSLGMNRLAEDRTKNTEDYQNETQNRAEQGREANQTDYTNNRQIDLQNTMQTFQRIMAGLGQSAVPGVRSGRVPGGGLL